MVGGQFREDLYYRLNVVHIEMPALGKSAARDIPLLVAHFLEQIAKESGQRKIYAPRGSGAPGDRRMARQRAPVVQRGAPETSHCRMAPSLPQNSCSNPWAATPRGCPSFDEARDEFTRNYLSQILQITGGNVQPGGTPGQAQPHRLLQAAVAPPIAAR